MAAEIWAAGGLKISNHWLLEGSIRSYDRLAFMIQDSAETMCMLDFT